MVYKEWLIFFAVLPRRLILMYENIRSLVENGEYQKAAQKIRELKNSEDQKRLLSGDDENPEQLYLLEATVCEALGDLRGEFLAIGKGLSKNQRNYELYYMLGLIYKRMNNDQAYLCFEQASRFCTLEEDIAPIRDEINECRKKPYFRVRNMSFIILSYNDEWLMKKCIKAIKDECFEGDEIIVVDNASTDGIAKWLRQQTGIRLIENGDNVGFSIGCNIGIIASQEENDVLLINNDAVLTPGALFWMRMGLYEDSNVGAVGAVSNNATEQSVEVYLGTTDQIDAAIKYGSAHNIPMEHPYENKVRLTGFCELIKREAINSVFIEHTSEDEAHFPESVQNALKSMRERKLLFDPRFTPAYFEDDDLGIRISEAGFRQILCHNAFVYHQGGDTEDDNGVEYRKNLMLKNRRLFEEKWGFDIWKFEAVSDDLINAVGDIVKGKLGGKPIYPWFRFLEIGCGFGVNLSALKYRFNDCYVAGTEGYGKVAALGKYMGDIIAGNIEVTDLPFTDHSFDIICIYDALNYAENQDELLMKLLRLLKKDGYVIVSKGCKNTIPKSIHVVEI